MSDIRARDTQIVRALASRCLELALSPEYEARRRRWRDVNELRRPDRAPVWCRPARCWQEIIPQSSLDCEDPTCRAMEYALRQNLYKHEVGDDHIFEPWWGVPVAWKCSLEHTWGIPIPPQSEATDKGGFRYDPPIKSPEDYDRVQVPHFEADMEQTQRSASQVQDILGESMPVQITCALTTICAGWPR